MRVQGGDAQEQGMSAGLKADGRRQFGETVEGYNIPVLNEREIRAAAGIVFVIILISFMLIIFKQNFVPIKYAISGFLVDFVVRLFVGPRYSPTLIVGRMIVGRQTPEYVGAAQKRFAWFIGLFLATTMFVLMVVLNSVSVINGLACLACMVFLFFESAFGICLGCLFYGWAYKEKAQYCPGEICDVKARQDIQKTSGMQVGIVLGFVALVVVLGGLFSGHLGEPPSNLWEMLRAAFSA